jgi:hypothetical protein
MSNRDANWKELVKNLVIDQVIELNQIEQILRKIYNLGEGKRKPYWERFLERKDRDALLSLLEVLVNETSCEGGYSSMVFPAIIGRQSAPNFWLYGEKNAPTQEEAWKAVYLLLSSVPFGNILLNLDNIKDTGRKRWRGLIISESTKEFLRRTRSDLNLKCKNLGSFFLSLLAITYWVYKIKEIAAQTGKELMLEEFMREVRENYGFRDDTTLIVFQMGREKKKEIHYFSRLSSFIIKWFKDYIEGREKEPSLIKFLDSLTSISSKKINSDLVSGTREKFVFDLLKYNEVNGELLSKLVELKVQDILGSKQRFGIMNAKDFYSRLKL